MFRSYSNNLYEIRWICALPLEMAMTCAMLDEAHGKLEKQDKIDTNNYHLGCIAEHNIVITCLPDYKNASANTLATQMFLSFSSIPFSLLVGIGVV